MPTTPPKSDQGSDREQPGKRPGSSAEEKLVPGPPDPEDPDDRKEESRMIQVDETFLSLKVICFFNMREGVIGHMIAVVMHVCKHVVGHLLVVLGRKNEGDQRSAIQLAADFTYIAGRHWRLMILLMLHTQMMGIVVMTGDRDNDIKSVASVLNEIGVGD